MRTWYKLTKRIFLLSIVILFILMLLLLGITTFDQNISWFSTLNIPKIQPPSWLFVVVWTAIYLMIAISIVIILGAPKTNEKHKTISIGLFIINGILNALYCILFFGMRSIVLAFMELPFLIASVVLLIICTKTISKTAAYLLIPYLIWILFATVLTGMLLFTN